MRERRRRRRHGSRILSGFQKGLARLRHHPLRLTLIVAFGSALTWLVVTKSLPFALAPAAPELALALDPNNPAALIARARQIGKRILEQSAASSEAAEPKDSAAQQFDTIAGLPEAKSNVKNGEPDAKRAAMRQEIRDLANRAIAIDPLNAEAYVLLGETAEDPGRVHAYMQEAVNCSRRETTALFWLLNDSYYHKDYQKALEYADLLLRTQPELSAYVMRYVALIAQAPEGFPLVVRALSKNPSWRKGFFETFPRNTQAIELPLKLMIALKEDNAPPSPKELAPYLDTLIGINRVDAAYNAWLQLLPAAELANAGLLMNGKFENAPSGLPFDWRIAAGLNAAAELVAPASDGGGRLLHVSFGSGRVKFPELSQIVLLPPGHYRLEGKLRGQISGKRGLRWQLTCASGTRKLLGQTDMLMGETRQWRIFALEAEVPAGGDCIGQVLRLLHDSRSASEEFISGEVWFGDLRLEHVRPAEAALKNN